MFRTPILLITFNRPEHTKRVLSAIVNQQPSDIFVFQDGAREGNPDDQEKCEAVRMVVKEASIINGIKIHTFFAEKNLGCGAGPMSAISWFFSKVKEGIVMEDDCLPHPDFFQYCSELLERYRNDERVMYISSTLYNDKWKCSKSYDFSHYMITGAWASWARAWDGFDLNLHGVDAKEFRHHLKRLLYSTVEANWWYFKLLEIQRDQEKKSYWDFQMQIHLFRKRGLTVHPQRNLISNIGFDEAGTHTLTNSDGLGNKMTYPILPLSHPETIIANPKRDYLCFAKVHSAGPIKDTIGFIYKSMLFNQGFFHNCLNLYKQLKNGRR